MVDDSLPPSVPLRGTKKVERKTICEIAYNVGEALRASSTKFFGKPQDGRVNSAGYGKNEDDWVIRG